MSFGITGFDISNFTNLTGGTFDDVITTLPPEILAPLETLLFILKTVGIIAVIYFIILIISAILNIRRSLKIKKIYKKVYEIDDKLDKILDQRKEEHKVLSKIDKKEHDSKKKLKK